MSKGQSLERMAKYKEAYLLYQEILQTWVTVGDPDHPFSSMLKTSLGSACRQLRRFSESKAFLLESFAQRKKLFGNENISYLAPCKPRWSRQHSWDLREVDYPVEDHQVR
jgi:hypothetical protein